MGTTEVVLVAGRCGLTGSGRDRVVHLPLWPVEPQCRLWKRYPSSCLDCKDRSLIDVKGYYEFNNAGNPTSIKLTKFWPRRTQAAAAPVGAYHM